MRSSYHVVSVTKGILLLALVLTSSYTILFGSSIERVWNERVAVMVKDEGNDSKNFRYQNDADQVLDSSAQCLSFDESFDDLVASSGSVYLAMPSKAAGTTFQKFVDWCVGQYDTKRDRSRYVFETESIEERADVFLENSKHPKLMASHVVNDAPLIRLFEHTPRDSLIIYSYRDETDRLVSAARHIVTEVCKGHRANIPETEYEMIDDKCVFNEEAIVNLILRPKIQELGGGAPETMTCKFYGAIEANLPRMVFVHYKQAEKVQQVLSKYYCPDIPKLFHKNGAGMKEVQVIVKRRNDGELVSLEDWIEAKRDKIEWTFEYKGDNECKAKTRKMEDDLFACKDEIIQMTGDMSF